MSLVIAEEWWLFLLCTLTIFGAAQMLCKQHRVLVNIVAFEIEVTGAVKRVLFPVEASATSATTRIGVV
jgi:hypothetical protein